MLLALMIIGGLGSLEYAAGQYYQNETQRQAAIIDACEELGIDPSDCNQEEILRHRQICPNANCSPSYDSSIALVTLVLFGSGIAMAVALATIRSIGRVQAK